MPRIIKFRGKFNDGDWEYGGLRYGDMGQAYILPHGATHRVKLVNRSSVGQFTGLLDRQGKEIYEGDIVRRWQKNKANGGKEYYSKQTGEFPVKWVQSAKYTGFDISFIGAKNMEVIGNIFSNPELLK